MMNEIKWFQDMCRRAGLKITHQRLEIYKELLNSKDHPTAEIIHKRLLERLPTLSLDTVYRTLTTFTAYGLANKVETAESLSRFEARQEPHHHLICTSCNSITDLPEFTTMTLPDAVTQWGRPESMVLIIYGICQACQKK